MDIDSETFQTMYSCIDSVEFNKRSIKITTAISMKILIEAVSMLYAFI